MNINFGRKAILTGVAGLVLINTVHAQIANSHADLYTTSACNFVINAPHYFDHSVGGVDFTEFNTKYIWLSANMGNMISRFDTDHDYEIITPFGPYYFRLNGIAYNPTGTDQTYIYDITWAFGSVPSAAGTYTVNAYNSERAPVFYRTIDTIGDSITWWQYGRYLRCLMRDGGLHYDFTGTHTDVFGFPHDGHGGDTTTDVLNRMATIPVADAYFVLIGTNDQTTAIQTSDNIIEISNELHNKNPCAKIYISTLLPRNDSYNTLNQKINANLRNYNNWCDKCTLIDLGKYVYSNVNWPTYFMPDGLHPNHAGFLLIAGYLADKLK
ncbi:SGNH/GDSL hydrolase family protein [Legionella dresdenensis]|uniref:SGNH/GDSL hydrolase family protein n=1 Tax=Legionella dresdenensis TaxID=450200 RepID=A0ABV8CCD7_9GAMM